MARQFAHETDAKRYAFRIDGDLVAVVDYAVLGTSISFTHTYTAPHLRGRGYAAEVVEFAVNDVEASGDLRIVPMCWYVGEWFDKHPDRARLLSR